jgi:outer membrane protein assembly factor BamB
MKRAFLLVLVFLLTLALVACGGESSPTPPPSTTPGVPPSGAAATTAATVPATTQAAATATPNLTPLGPQPPTPTAPAQVPVISAQQANAVPLKTLWQINVGESGPVELVGEADGLVFVKSLGGSLYAFNTKDGSLAWKQAGTSPFTPPPTATPLPSPAPGSPAPAPDQQPPPRAPFSAITSGTVIIGDPAAEQVRAFDTKTGQKKWEASLKFDAPNRDPGNRFLPGGIYEDTVVTVVSSKLNPFSTKPGSNPEYLRLVGLDIATGKQKWDFVPTPAPAGVATRQTAVIYGTKNVVVLGPEYSTYGLDPKTGAVLWRTLNLEIIGNPAPDTIYATIPQAPGTPHYPIVTKLDLNTGKPVWQRTIPIQLNTEQPIAFSPDEKTVYVSVFSSAQKSYLWTLNLDANDVRQTDTSAYGIYDMLTTDNGVMLVEATPGASGVVYLDVSKDKPSWGIGGVLELLFGPDRSPEKDSYYLTFRDELGNSYLYSVNWQTGQVISTNRVDLVTSPPYFSPTQKILYITGGTTNPQLYALARP